jgi:hypothetical protein
LVRDCLNRVIAQPSFPFISLVDFIPLGLNRMTSDEYAVFNSVLWPRPGVNQNPVSGYHPHNLAEGLDDTQNPPSDYLSNNSAMEPVFTQYPPSNYLSYKSEPESNDTQYPPSGW